MRMTIRAVHSIDNIVCKDVSAPIVKVEIIPPDVCCPYVIIINYSNVLIAPCSTLA